MNKFQTILLIGVLFLTVLNTYALHKNVLGFESSPQAHTPAQIEAASKSQSQVASPEDYKDLLKNSPPYFRDFVVEQAESSFRQRDEITIHGITAIIGDEEQGKNLVRLRVHVYFNNGFGETATEEDVQAFTDAASKYISEDLPKNYFSLRDQFRIWNMRDLIEKREELLAILNRTDLVDLEDELFKIAQKIFGEDAVVRIHIGGRNVSAL